jgi:integrase
MSLGAAETLRILVATGRSVTPKPDTSSPSVPDGSARTVPIPRALAVILARHKLVSRHVNDDQYVFSTCTGRPFGQQNIRRALRRAQSRARNETRSPTFPILHERDHAGRPVSIPHGVLPSMHSFRHTVASRALLAGESVDEVAFLLGHRNANVTRAVYVRELADARRRTMRRSRMVAEFADLLQS